CKISLRCHPFHSLCCHFSLNIKQMPGGHLFYVSLFYRLIHSNSIYKLFCNGKPELYQRPCKTYRHNGSRSHGSSSETPQDYEEKIASHSHPAKFYFLDLIGQDHRHKIVGTSTCVTVDHNRHSGCQDHTSDEHTCHSEDHGGIAVYVSSEKPCKEINDRSAAERAYNGSRFHISLRSEKHHYHQDTENDHMDRSNGQAEDHRQTLDKDGKSICTQSR